MDYGKERALEFKTREWLKTAARRATHNKYNAEWIYAKRHATDVAPDQQELEQRPEFLAAVAYLTNRQLRIFPIGEIDVPTSTTEFDD